MFQKCPEVYLRVLKEMHFPVEGVYVEQTQV